jgi:hypothetical protein
LFFEKLWKCFLNRKQEEAKLLELVSELVKELIRINRGFVVEFKNEIFEVF